MSNSIAILILAAGQSSRMGTPKQLLPWKNTTLLGHAIKTAQGITNNVFVVLGANAAEINKSITLKDVNFILNPDFKNGMGSSIASGIKSIVKENHFKSVLILLADQPFIDVAHLVSMLKIQSSNIGSIIATSYANNLGVPAIFPRKQFPILAELNGEQGAKSILKSQHNICIKVDAPEKIIDIDTPEAYKKALNSNKVKP